LQVAISVVVFLGVACAGDDERSDVDLAEKRPPSEVMSIVDAGPATDAGQAGDAADATVDSAVATGPGMMYHLVDRVDATSLELKGDGTFRWLMQGCDFGYRESGRWIEESGSMFQLGPSGAYDCDDPFMGAWIDY
jgi:hypothetical protein